MKYNLEIVRQEVTLAEIELSYIPQIGSTIHLVDADDVVRGYEIIDVVAVVVRYKKKGKYTDLDLTRLYVRY